MSIRDNVSRLRRYVKAIVSARVNSYAGYRDWRADNEPFMEECFLYERVGDMPKITSLVKPFFHPELPLIGLNYTPVAHNTLHNFPAGWTAPLRLCRGLVFSRRGTLVAKPFDKFFNYGEMPETRELPDEPWVATVKHDGHLGIIFEFDGGLHLTTRGSFESRTCEFGNEMLARYSRDGDWLSVLPGNVTLLVEVIHPDTEVHLDYGGEKKFVVIGAYDRRKLIDFDYDRLGLLAGSLGLPVTERWSGDSIAELREHMADLSVENQEGFVVRFASGRRVKFKFASYINMMVASKLGDGGHLYLMNRVLTDSLDRMTGNLEAEEAMRAEEIVAELRGALDVAADEPDEKKRVKARRQYLYGLVPEEESTPYFRTRCRRFLEKIEADQAHS